MANSHPSIPSDQSQEAAIRSLALTRFQNPVVQLAQREYARRRLIDLFLEGKSEQTIRAYRADLETFAEFLRAADLDEAAELLLGCDQGQANEIVMSYRSAMLDRKLSPATINRRLAAIRSLVKVARMIGRVAWTLEIPMVRAQRYRDTKGPGLLGFRCLYDAACSQKGIIAARDRAILRVMWSQGLRRAEVVELDLAHFEEAGRRLSVLGKGRRERQWMELPEKTAACLREWVELRGLQEGPLFTNLDRRTKGGRLTGQGLYKIVRSLGESVGIRTRPHGIRHATITQRIQSGMTLPEVQDFSRHSDIKTLMVYNDRLNNAAGKLAAMADAEI